MCAPGEIKQKQASSRSVIERLPVNSALAGHTPPLSFKMEPRRALRRAIDRRESVKIERTGREQPPVYGFPLAVGRELALVVAVPDFDPDGFQVLPIDQIAHVRSGERERFLEMVLRDEHRLHEIWPARGQPPYATLPLDEWRMLFGALAARQEMVIVECERRRVKQDFFIGPVIAVAEGAVGMRFITPTAEWDAEPSVVPFAEITRARFAERYTQVLSRYAHEPPAS